MSSCIQHQYTHRDKFFHKLFSYSVIPVDSQTSNKKTLLSSLSNGMSAGVSVEAALALPLFLFFMINLLSLFTVYETYSKNLADTYEKARHLAMVAHTLSDTDEMVDLYKTQKMSPLYEYIGFNDTYTKASVHMRKWTGYNIMSTETMQVDEEYVYITESGTAYHRSRDCSHLKISIHIIKAENAVIERNDYGQRYRPCEKCALGCSTGLVFVTDKGDRYHNNAACSALKRTIKTVPLSQVGGRGPCSECGGN